MEEFNSIEKVKELFNKANCTGSENCYFVAYKDTTKSSGMLSGMEYPYDGVLMDQTENGIGLYNLKQSGIVFKVNLNKMSLDANSYQFIKNEDIKSLTVKNYALLNSKMKRIQIKLNDGKVHNLFAKLNEDALPYQNENFSKFVQKYSK